MIHKHQTNIANRIHRPILAVALAVSVWLCNSALCQDLKSQAFDHFKNESYTEAIEALKLALTQHPEDAELWFYLGWFTHYYCYDSVPFAGSERAVSDSILVYLKKALSLNPSLHNVYSFVGSEYGSRSIRELQFRNMAGFHAELRMGKEAGGYPDWLLEYARNVLRSCGKNAILIAGGDPEAFPIWYCQFVERFRRDVTAIPFALLGSPWFVLLLKNGVPGFFAPIQVPWSEQQITDMHPYKWKAQIVNIQPPSSITDAVRFHIQPDLTSADRELLSPHRALLVDMIKVNRWQRPVQFTLGCPPFVTAGIDDYLQLAGTTRRLVPFMAKATGRFIDVELTMSLLVDQSNFRLLSTVRDQDIPRISNILNNYRVLFLLVSDTLAQCGRPNEAAILLNRMENLVPQEVLPMSEGYREHLEQIWARIRQAESKK